MRAIVSERTGAAAIDLVDGFVRECRNREWSFVVKVKRAGFRLGDPKRTPDV
jgi:hypothetical protein